MMQIASAFEFDDTTRIILQYLLHGCAEMVMQRRAFPDTDVLSAFLIELIDLRLYDDADTFHEEHTAEHRNHQLLVYDHGADADDASYGKAARVAEEDLCGKSVEPQITDQRTDEGREEHHYLFRARDVHHIEILRPDDTTAGISQHEQGYADDS